MTTTPRNLGVALTGKPHQELTTFFYWRPSIGKSRYSAIVDSDIPLPQKGEITEFGNVLIKAEYIMRVLANATNGGERARERCLSCSGSPFSRHDYRH